MGRHFTISAAMLICALFIGCATQQQAGNSASDEVKVEYIRDSYKPVSLPENDPHTGQQLVKKAQSAIGTPYVYGGSNPGGFDCSGLVKWAYNSVGVNLPRTAREQSVVGEKVHNVADMRAGDIVAFRHPKRGYHTGIYMGDGKFIHSPRRKTHVRINSLSDPYFSKTLLGARRINMASGENLVAQANERLDKMIAETTNLTVSAKNVRARKAQRAHDLLAAKSKKTAREVAAKSKKAKNQLSAKNMTKNKKTANLTKAVAHNGKATNAAKQVSKQGKSVNNNKQTANNIITANTSKQAVKTKSAANNSKNKNIQKTIAINNNKKQVPNKAAVKKQTSKTVSMLSKKNTKAVQKGSKS